MALFFVGKDVSSVSIASYDDVIHLSKLATQTVSTTGPTAHRESPWQPAWQEWGAYLAVYRDSHLQMTVDLSHLNFIFLANDLGRIAAPLKDRLKVVQLDPPTARQIADIATREVERRGLDPGLVPILRRATVTGKVRSLRKLHKLLDVAQATKFRPLLN